MLLVAAALVWGAGAVALTLKYIENEKQPRHDTWDGETTGTEIEVPLLR